MGSFTHPLVALRSLRLSFTFWFRLGLQVLVLMVNRAGEPRVDAEVIEWLQISTMALRKAVARSPPMARTPSVALPRSRTEPETPPHNLCASSLRLAFLASSFRFLHCRMNVMLEVSTCAAAAA